MSPETTTAPAVDTSVELLEQYASYEAAAINHAGALESSAVSFIPEGKVDKAVANKAFNRFKKLMSAARPSKPNHKLWHIAVTAAGRSLKRPAIEVDQNGDAVEAMVAFTVFGQKDGVITRPQKTRLNKAREQIAA